MMVSFSSLEFLFRFLPVFLVLYFLTPVKYREWTLLFGSLIFYALGEPVFFLLLIAATFFNYGMGMKIWKLGEGFTVQEWRLKKRKQILGWTVAADVTLLLLFKGLAVFTDSTLLPLGISFYIFKMISFQADLFRREITVKPGWKQTMLYFVMFPQITSGPVMRYNEGAFGVEKRSSPEQVEDGLKYFIIGLGFKVLLADRLAILWKDLQMIGFQSISTPLAWLGAAGYSLQIYFDFWGYSLMSSGLLVMLGYDFVENFRHPYGAGSISDFYRRWHVTLGSWFRDYVYIPLGGSRCSKKRLVLHLGLVWLLTGIWHGNGFNYIIWGAALGILILLEKLFYGSFLKKAPVFRNLYVLTVIPLTWVVFAITDLKSLGIYFGRLFPLIGGAGVAVNHQDIVQYACSYGVYFLAGILFSIPAVFRFYEKHKKNPLSALFLTVVFWLSVYLLSCSEGNPFLYLNF